MAYDLIAFIEIMGLVCNWAKKLSPNILKLAIWV